MREWTQNNRMLQGGAHFPLCLRFNNVCRRSESALKRRSAKQREREMKGVQAKNRRLGPLGDKSCKHCHNPHHKSEDCPTLKTREQASGAWDAIAHMRALQAARTAPTVLRTDHWDSCDPWAGYVPTTLGYRTSGDCSGSQSFSNGWGASSADGSNYWSTAPAACQWG